MTFKIKASDVEFITDKTSLNNYKNYSSLNNQDFNKQHIVQQDNDLAETIKELNSDKLDDNNFSDIDMKTRLLSIEISSIIAVDCLVAMGFLPNQASFITRSKKRLAVSLMGKGRDDIVNIAGGIREQKSGMSMFDKLGGMFNK